jgi:actin-related protein
MASVARLSGKWLDGLWVTRKEFEEAGEDYLYDKQPCFDL